MQFWMRIVYDSIVKNIYKLRLEKLNRDLQECTAKSISSTLTASSARIWQEPSGFIERVPDEAKYWKLLSEI